ncbi:exonuclease domain-containing protein [Sphingobacterium litopenaei]|uniref:GIY-YIG nuclease family protein n=1 Tax=Sphingobacterium litopenaei TaxID=2763500 RepID=A0ABR7YG12_9SPHI|nr:exonuclease domain-containing protein [Sphingobacterium litopenaei]MBD1430220.1 GIY-YIG nuclease family protein [Sphingobacterium litopenaei]
MEYAIVDIETTGSYAAGNKITEIAIVIHNGTHILEKFQSLVNPGAIIPFHIQALTGISNEMVEDAPYFNDIASTVYNLLHKRIFVAHNVNFDYSFLVEELKNAGYSWRAPKLCTVRLSRKIIPNQSSYSLGKLCQNLGIIIHDRHRAMGDADATVTLFEKLVREDKENLIESTLKKTKEHRLPTHINEDDFLKLPETTGVYIFHNATGKIIYVGKAVNIRKRVLSHFSGTNGTQKRQAFINDIHHIDYLETGTELMSLLTECKLIKQYWPTHNRALKKFEPKFSLIQYTDQNDYIRLVVSPYDKHAKAIQHFERPYEANQLLLQLMEEFELDNKLCYFYSVHNEPKPKLNYATLPNVDQHNEKVEAAIEKIAAQSKSFVLVDQGRNLNEKSYILFRNNTLYAFGYFDVELDIVDYEDLVKEDDKCLSNYYMNSLVLQYIERYPSKVKKLLHKAAIDYPID